MVQVAYLRLALCSTPVGDAFVCTEVVQVWPAQLPAVTLFYATARAFFSSF
jgi:hypothetical protein